MNKGGNLTSYYCQATGKLHRLQKDAADSVEGYVNVPDQRDRRFMRQLTLVCRDCGARHTIMSEA